jgi:glucuronate isomerase
MKPLIHDDFLLNNNVAKKLYHTYAKHLPIIDYHCHLEAKAIYEDQQFDNLTHIWLGGDHYKWRLMRTNGTDETYITGHKDDVEKFNAWASVVPQLLGNPLYHWTHLELKRFFNIDLYLSPKTAKQIYKDASSQLKTLTARRLIEMSNVELICTTDDPVDSLIHHKKLREEKNFKTHVIPAFRPDKAVNIELTWFTDWLKQLEEIAGYKIKSLKTFKQALVERINYFHEQGCRLADHGIDRFVYEASSEDVVANIFNKALDHGVLTDQEIKQYKGHMMLFFGHAYHKLNWVQQYHIGARRNVSTRMFSRLGPDAGFDSINDYNFIEPLSACLDALDQNNALPKTIIYTLNPRDFEPVITLMQAFQGDGVPGKIQFGSSWWFLDSIDGMTKQIKALANNGLISKFVGMLTDSRSFLSYPRHEYFRRLLCQIIGKEVTEGYFPEDYDILGKLVQDICYYNAKNYFNF